VTRARIGVIGAGWWAAYQYLPFYRDHAEVELVGAVRRDETGLDVFRREFGLEISTSSVDELLAAASSSPRRTACTASTPSPPSRPEPTCWSRSR
jgi:predicted dehydrogenase